MNHYQQSLFNNLMTLCNSNEAFYFADQELEGRTYRIFNYRLATYTHFQEPDALECRGIMFEIDGDGNATRLAAHPQIKFFNLGENPFTMDLDITDSSIDRIELKEDGSLMSSFVYEDNSHVTLGIKSKGSLHSDQCAMTYKYLEHNRDLEEELRQIGKEGYTVNMELTSPNNRIVLNYAETKLVVLNIRCTSTGRQLRQNELDEIKYPLLFKHWVPEAWHLGYDTGAMLVHRAKDLIDIEGFIVYLRNGTVFKLKTEWYLIQHRAKDNVDSPRRLFEAAINEATDDLRSLFHDNQMVLDRIEEMETFAAGIYNNTIDKVEKFVEANRDLIKSGDRKSFAIKGQQELEGKIFGLAMQCYTGKEPDYKAFCLKHWRDWGLTDKEDVE